MFSGIVRNEKATILIVAFILILILTAFSFALFFPASIQSNATNLNLEKIHALNVAEAALANAINDLKNGGDGILGDSVAPLAFNNGLYYTNISQDTPSAGKHTVLATGQYGRVTSVVTATIKITGEASSSSSGGEEKFNPSKAVMTGGSIKIQGSVDILGGIHSNESVVLQGGGSNIQGTVSASGTVEGNIGSVTYEENIEPLPLPEINPLDHKEEAEYVLKNDGKVYDSGGSYIHDTTTDGPFQHWQHDGLDGNGIANWSYAKKKDAIDGFFYIEGHVKLNGGEKKGEPWKLTLITTGHIEIAGNPNLQPYHPDNVVLIAGTDLKLRGNAQTTLSGFYGAHEQIDIAGNPSIVGSLYAENAEDLDNFISLVPHTLDDGTTVYLNILTGNPSFTWADLEVFLLESASGAVLVEILGTGIAYQVASNN